jgi:hypothetical protein
VKGDFSRLTFRQDKHYSSVRLQQGRVQLDADWNEQVDIQAHHDRTAARDTVGARGGPVGRPGFEVSAGASGLMIGDGHYYVDGILCENEADVSFTAQPDLPDATLPTDPGSYLAYLDVWQRHVTAVEDPAIREVALGGPDTATRTRTVWQVKLQEVDNADDCAEFGEDWEPAGAASTGELRAQARPPEDAPDDPCIVPPGAGYTRLENQLYRVEIHDGGEPYGARSQSAITEIQGVEPPHRVRVANDGQTWRVDQWVELFRDGSTTPGTLARITAVEATRGSTMLTFGDEDLSGTTPNRLRRVATFKFSRHNGATLARLEKITDNFVTVSDPGRDPTLGFAGGKRVELSDEARTLRGEPGVMVELASVTGNDLEVVWPNGAPPSMGGSPTTRRWDSEGAIPLSTRTQWQDLEDGVQVGFGGGTYRSGDYWLIPARSLRGEVQWPQGTNGPSFEPPHGIEHHYCPLALLDLTNGTWTVETDCRQLFPPLTGLVASKVGYTPGAECRGLEEVTTVQEAIDELCKTGPGAQGIRILDVRTVAPDATLANDASVPVSALAEGLRVECDAPVDPEALTDKPTCLVTLDMPYPFSEEERKFWETEEIVGYRPLVLRGEVSAVDRSIRWVPAPEMEGWLRETLFEKMAAHERGDTIVAHLTLKGNFIWAEDNRLLFLDGEAVSVPETREEPTGLDLPSGDDRRGGDFEMWFRIKSELFSVRSVELDPGIVIGGSVVTGTVETHGTVTRPVNITVRSSDPAAAVFSNGQGQITVTVPRGSSEVRFPISTRPVLTDRPVTISAFSADAPETVKTATMTVQKPALDNINCDPNVVAPGDDSRGTISLRGLAPAGMEIRLSANPEVLVSLPSTVEVDEGSSSKDFRLTISTDAVEGEPIEIEATYEDDFVRTNLTVSSRFPQ